MISRTLTISSPNANSHHRRIPLPINECSVRFKDTSTRASGSNPNEAQHLPPNLQRQISSARSVGENVGIAACVAEEGRETAGNGTMNVSNTLDLPGDGKNREPKSFKALWKISRFSTLELAERERNTRVRTLCSISQVHLTRISIS